MVIVVILAWWNYGYILFSIFQIFCNITYINKKMAIATITNLPPCSMQVSLKNTRVNLRIRDRIYIPCRY